MCRLKDLVSVEPGRKVESVVVSANMAGFHHLSVVNSPLCFFFPLGVTKFFMNIEVLEIDIVQLVNISSVELKQFLLLRELTITRTPLVSLEGDLFKHNGKLEMLMLANNRIKIIEAGLFKPLKKLIEFDFTGNECFNRKASGAKSVDRLMDRVEEECKAEPHEIKSDHDNQTIAITISCSANSNHWTLLGHVKECQVTNLILTSASTIVENVTSIDSLDTFRSLSIEDSPHVYFMPTGIAKFLHNLEVLVLDNTQLVKITCEDLMPFPALRGLFIDFSNLTTLEEDLFQHSEKLEILSLTHSQIKTVAGGVFKPLAKLFDFDFHFNPCYSKREFYTKNVERMIESIETGCKGGEEEKPKNTTEEEHKSTTEATE